MITDEKSFIKTAMSFYDNKECNSIEEFEQDLGKILLIRNHIVKYNNDRETNLRLLINHFISFVNCFGIISEHLLKYRLKDHKKINALFVLIGVKQFDGTFEVDETFFIDLQKTINNRE